MGLRASFWAVSLLLLSACGRPPMLRVTDGSDWKAYVGDRSGGAPKSDPATVRFRAGLCDGENLQPEVALLDEGDLVRFLERQRIDVRIERPRADLVYLNLTGVGTETPVRLRVAILTSADEAGSELNEAILQHGKGSWGVHRSNLAVLGPYGSLEDDLTFAAKVKLACWGVFTVAGSDESFAVAGGYREL
jgi:hypothetical protein